MKTLLLCLATSLALPFSVFSQNKSLGVGTTTPNPNAVLHVESPTNNQGLIIPRLTTAQRSSFTSALTATDVGLIVFDTDLRALTIWNGSAWDISGKVGTPISVDNTASSGSAAVIAINNTLNDSPALLATTNGGPGGSFNAPAILATTATAGSAIIGRATGGFSNGISGIADPGTTAGSFAVLGSNNGLGTAGTFSINNVVNSSNVLNASTNGLGSAAEFEINNATSSAPSLIVNNNGLGQGGQFNINNVTSSASALVTTNYGLGTAGFFLSNNSAATQPTLIVNNTGLGRGGQFQNTNAANTNAALRAANTGLGNAGFFSSTNTAANQPAVVISANSNTAGGATILGTQNGTGDGGAYFRTQNASNPYQALHSETNGTGAAANFIITNATSSAPVLNLNHAGTGNAITANRPIQATNITAIGNLNANGLNYTWPAAQASGVLTNNGSGGLSWVAGGGLTLPFSSPTTTGTGIAGFSVTNTNNGLAGEFRINNAGSNGTSFFASTNGIGYASQFSVNNASSTGSAVYAEHSGAGAAIHSIATGSGRAVNAQVNNASSSANVFAGTTLGTGAVGNFQIQNSSNGSPVIIANTDGAGSAASFSSSNATNSQAVVSINHSGSGNAITANRPIQATQFTASGSLNASLVDIIQTGSTNGGGVFQILNGANGASALTTTTNGTGSGISVNVSNAGSAAPAINISHTGTGNAITANAPIEATGFSAPSGTGSFYSVTTGAGGDSFGGSVNVNGTVDANNFIGESISAESTGGTVAAYFRNYSGLGGALSAISNGPQSAANIGHAGEGVALEISVGGLKYNVTNVASAGTVFTRSTVYNVTVTGTFTLDWSPASGDVMYVWNNNGSSITFAGATVNASTLAHLIYVGGAWRMNQ